jgi:hypothetical protein
MNAPATILRAVRFVASAAVLLAVICSTSAAEPRSAVAKHVSATGMLLAQQGPDKPWKALAENEEVYSGDTLVALPGAAIESKNGAVRLNLLTDFSEASPFPVMESSVTLHANGKEDLDFTLTRGRVDVTNLKKEGAAVVQVRFHDEDWELTLDEPGTRVALELYGRWARGVPFSHEPKADQKPMAQLAVLMIKGEAHLDHGMNHFRLHAPPGPALFSWDSVHGPDNNVKRLDKLPEWADPSQANPERAKEIKARIERLRQRLAQVSPPTALAQTLDSEDRRTAVVALGAIDDLWGLTAALANPFHPEVRDQAVLVLRHWIGRCPGQDQKLYDFLVNVKKFSPAEAETILQLLHSLSEQQLGRPEAFELLIEYLKHDLLPVRELAQWYLYRVVPAGKDIKYDAAGTPAERHKAYEAWKKLIPEGKLPPAVKIQKG